MKISGKTKISDIIKENPDTIDVIASINKNFKKLKNPFLRKILAKRITIEDAARIGSINVNVIFEKLAKIGFEFENDKPDENGKRIEENGINSKTANDMQTFKKENVHVLDVRPILDGGVDPFNDIMKTLKKLPENSVLQIINTFEPIPLINILRSKGYEAFSERPTRGIVHTFLKKVEGEKADDAEVEIQKPDKEKFNEKVIFFGDKLREVDVRDLEMPMPMVTILQELEQVPEGFGLLVHHKKFPQFLLPELKNRGYGLVSDRIDDDNVKLIIFK